MMISPKGYIETVKDLSYEELLKERDSLLRRIRKFERDYRKNSDDLLLVARCPSPDVEYLCNLMYLAELCNLISDKFIEKRDGEIPYWNGFVMFILILPKN